MSKTKTKTKISKQKIEINGEKKTITPIEKLFALDRIIKYKFKGADIGALLLKKGENYQVVFGFKCNGLNNVLPQAQVDNVFDPLENGLKDFPDSETLTIHQSLLVDPTKRIEQLQQARKDAPTLELKYFLMSEEKLTEELSNKGIRKEIELNLYATYTFTKEGKKSKDPIEQALKSIEKCWHSFVGSREEAENHNLQLLLEEAFDNGYERWQNLLSNKLGLEVKTHTTEEIWKCVTKRFGKKEVLPPQILHVSEEGLEIEINSHLNPVSRVFTHNPVPVANTQFVRCRGQYTGVMSLLDKPEGWKDKRTQLQTIWRIISRQEIYNTEIICQLKKGNVRRVREAMQSLAKQAMTDGEVATKSNNVDVSAKLRTEKALKAQEALYSDDIPFEVATVFLIHRNNLKELNSACNYLSSQFQSPLELFRETTYAHITWLQTFPIYWDRLLVKPFNRTSTYLNTEIPALMPLTQPNSGDKKGIEFLSIEGGVPIHLDLWSRLRHMIVLATNRAGKGIFVSKVVMRHQAKDIPVSILDFPRPDGTSTFSDFANFLGKDAEYFNTKIEKFNIFEIPDLSQLDLEQQVERFQDFKEFLIDILETMVVGSKPRQNVNPDTVRSLLVLAIEKFYSKENIEIHNRFTAAYLAGMGTPEWENTPVLADFIKSLGPERLELVNPTEDTIRHLEIVKIRLKYWLSTRVGKAISAPSTIDSKAKLIVYAMANLEKDDDAAVMMLAINMQALRKSMQYPESVILIDEVSILVKFDPIAKMISRFCANGLKSGIQILMVGQDVDSIAKSPYGSQILQNTPIKVIGRIESKAVDSMVKELGIEQELIQANATKAFYTIPQLLASNWLVSADGVTNACRYYADEILLGSVANNPNEVALRKEIMAKHDNKFDGLTEFSRINAERIKNI